MYELIILMILEFYGTEWKEELVSETAQMLYDDFYWFKIAELKHFMLKCKSGQFGKVYGKFSPVTFIDWMGQYADESLRLREQIAVIDAGNERYDERWGCHDERKERETTEISMKGQMEIIKSELKNKQKDA